MPCTAGPFATYCPYCYLTHVSLWRVFFLYTISVLGLESATDTKVHDISAETCSDRNPLASLRQARKILTDFRASLRDRDEEPVVIEPSAQQAFPPALTEKAVSSFCEDLNHVLRNIPASGTSLSLRAKRVLAEILVRAEECCDFLWAQPALHRAESAESKQALASLFRTIRSYKNLFASGELENLSASTDCLMADYAYCGGKNSLLWNSLYWYKRAIAHGSRKAAFRECIGETYGSFGFFGTSLHKSRSGLAYSILFDDEDAFIRYEGKYIALLYRDWKRGMSFEERHTAITIEEEPRFICAAGLTGIESFNISEAEQDDIRRFIRINRNLICTLGLTTNPNSQDYVDTLDYSLRGISAHFTEDMFDEVSAHCTQRDCDDFYIIVGTRNIWFSEKLGEFTRPFHIPHAYIWSTDGRLATRFRLDSTEPPDHLEPLFDTDLDLGTLEAQVLVWAKKAPVHMMAENVHTNWDAMRASWQDSYEYTRCIKEQ